MRRALLAMLVTVVPLTAAAQETSTAAAPFVSEAAANASSGATASQPAATRRSTKRRGSMVGYIEDPTVGSQVRVRFDAGWDMDSPDRAEFFYAKCGCYRDLPATSAFYDPDAPGPGPGQVTGMNFTQFDVQAEYGVKSRLSLFANLPFRGIRPTGFVANSGSFDNQFGLSDIKMGAKVSLFSDDATDVTVMVRGSVPSGDSRKGLGTSHGSLEPALVFRRDVNEHAGLQGQFGFWTPLSSSKGPQPAVDGDFSGNILYYGIGPSFDVAHTAHATVSPVVELVGWHVLSGYQTSSLATNGGKADGTNIVNLKIGTRISMSNNGSFYVGYGWALTDSDWYGKILRLEYRKGF